MKGKSKPNMILQVSWEFLAWTIPFHAIQKSTYVSGSLSMTGMHFLLCLVMKDFLFYFYRPFPVVIVLNRIDGDKDVGSGQLWNYFKQPLWQYITTIEHCKFFEETGGHKSYEDTVLHKMVCLK